MDELAYATGLDPIALRLRNYANVDPGNGKPFSTKSLKPCYQIGMDKFGWERRTPKPRSMRARRRAADLGMGMATATYPARRSPSSALARILPDGTALVEAGTQDIGTGTYTIMTQIAADALGLPPAKVRFELGDTKMPETPVSGGSQTAASTGSAVQQTCMDAKAAAIRTGDRRPRLAAPRPCRERGNGHRRQDRQSQRADTRRNLRRPARAYQTAQRSKPAPNPQQTEADKAFSTHSFGAVFAEVLVDPDLGEIRCSRLTGVYGVGTILNAKTARSQLIGGVVYGVGMALTEATIMDERFARVVNHDLAEYHVPVNADIPDIDITFVDEHDPHVSLMGAKGIGEIGITGVVAAIGNAVYHATGVRVRDLPITLDKVMVHDDA